MKAAAYQGFRELRPAVIKFRCAVTFTPGFIMVKLPTKHTKHTKMSFFPFS